MSSYIDATVRGGMNDLIALSIVSHGHGPLLGRLLEELDQCEDLSGVAVIVTLNMPDECFDSVNFKRLRVRVVRNKVPLGFGANHNQAFRYCQTPWFVILNPDLRIIDSSCFAKLVSAARSVPKAALLAPLVRNSTGEVEDAVRRNLSLFALLRRITGHEAPPPNVMAATMRGKPFYWLAGMFLMTDANVFRRLSGFDERYFLYCEDYDLSARIYNAGYALMRVEEAEVAHDAQRDSHRSATHLGMHVASLFRVWISAAFWKVVLIELPLRIKRWRY